MNTRRFGWAALVGVLGIAGLPACSAIVGIKDLPTEDGNGSGSGGSGSGGSGSGGSGSGGGNSDKALRFVGTWTITTGSNSSSCNGAAPTQYTDSGTLTVVRGTSSDLVMTPPNGCTLEANITAANTATLIAGQSCSGQQNGIAVIFFPSGTFQIDDGATTGQVNVSGNLDAENSSGASEQCTFTQTDNYARSS